MATTNLSNTIPHSHQSFGWDNCRRVVRERWGVHELAGSAACMAAAKSVQAAQRYNPRLVSTMPAAPPAPANPTRVEPALPYLCGCSSCVSFYHTCRMPGQIS